jgi:hypothetical protein
VLLPLLWEGERAQALRHLQSLRPPSGEVPPALQDAIRYLETHQDWLGNYGQWLGGAGSGGGDEHAHEKTGHALEAGQCHRCRGFTRSAHQC